MESNMSDDHDIKELPLPVIKEDDLDKSKLNSSKLQIDNEIPV